MNRISVTSRPFALLPLCATLLICLLSGCMTQQNPPPQQKPVEQPRIAHTFEPLPYTRGDLAMDRATGQKCRTWDFECGCYSNIRNDFDKKSANLKVGTEAYSQLESKRDKELVQCAESQWYGMRCDGIDALPLCDTLQKEMQ